MKKLGVKVNKKNYRFSIRPLEFWDSAAGSSTYKWERVFRNFSWINSKWSYVFTTHKINLKVIKSSTFNQFYERLTQSIDTNNLTPSIHLVPLIDENTHYTDPTVYRWLIRLAPDQFLSSLFHFLLFDNSIYRIINHSNRFTYAMSAHASIFVFICCVEFLNFVYLLPAYSRRQLHCTITTN